MPNASIPAPIKNTILQRIGSLLSSSVKAVVTRGVTAPVTEPIPLQNPMTVPEKLGDNLSTLLMCPEYVAPLNENPKVNIETQIR